ncbi:MAG TPA: thiamine phosphate synthase [Thermoanaerobaculia bacterium]|nr:thiamine phosphate synthase [Thermoanaerobaculia bacterium]
MNPRLPSLYAVTDRSVSGISSVREIARRLFAVGVRCVQVREKALPDRELLQAVEDVRGLAASCGAVTIVNDRVDVARVCGVGAHLGEEDMPASLARLLLPEGLIGVSTHDVRAARAALDDPAADYVAFGPVFESSTKAIRAPRGLEDLARAAAGRRKPLVAIGGITAENLDAVFDAGADSVAMVAGLLGGGAIEENARRVLDRIRRRRPPGRLYLVGFMGCGKTAIGRRLAARLQVPFVDVDAEIERASGLTVRALFEESGEPAFRQREAVFLAGTESLSNAVVATGGGAYVPDANRRAMRRLGRVVFLDVPFPVLSERLAGKLDRPLFQSVEQAARLFAQRDPFYRMGSLRVTLQGNETLDEAADRVLCALEGALVSPAGS